MKQFIKLSCQRLCQFLFILPLVLASTNGFAGISVCARFEPEEISMADRGQLMLEVRGNFNQVEEPNLFMPNVFLKRVHAAHMVNGENSISVYRYSVTPKEPGLFSLDTSTVTIDGKVYGIPPVRMLVTPTAARTKGRQRDSGSGKSSLANAFNLQLLSKKETLYLGQQEPVTIVLQTPRGVAVRLDGREPEKVGEGFARNRDFVKVDSDDSAQDGGQTYRWKSLITPTKEGYQELSFVLTLQAEIPGESNKMDGLQSSLDKRLVWEEITLKTPVKQIHILPLPAEGRPNNFSGLIGEFKIPSVELKGFSEKLSREELQSLRLQFTVVGTGNFSELEVPLSRWRKEWLIEKEQRQFHGADDLGLSGSEAFSMVVEPKALGLLRLPPVEFSYFNPKTGTYEIARQEIQTIAAVELLSPTSTPVFYRAKDLPENRTLELPTLCLKMGSEPLRLELSGKRLYANPWFWGFQGLVAYCFLRFLLWSWGHYWRVSEMRRICKKIKSKSTRDQIVYASEAIKARDPKQFFYALKLAIIASLSKDQPKLNGAMTITEVGKTIDPNCKRRDFLISEIHYFFSAYEQVSLFGSSNKTNAMATIFIRALRLLETLQEVLP